MVQDRRLISDEYYKLLESIGKEGGLSNHGCALGASPSHVKTAMHQDHKQRAEETI